ncbi:hypothetical protein [Flavobacterium luteolum]|uniref:hypothetical protein n=1 Tax=Flavobacterium luteolum TaxID=3003259 RepID=UPI00248EC6C8|nr:hypothetical protein [Flavobacterium luteolum]
MITKNDVAKVFDTVLSSPGMSEPVRIDLKISRKNVLLLSCMIEHGLLLEKDSGSLLGNISEEGLSDLKNIAQDFLEKAGLVELNQKLSAIGESIKA